MGILGSPRGFCVVLTVIIAKGGDLSSAHPFLAQRHDACTVESDWATLVNPLRLGGVDAGALLTDEARH